MIISDDQLFEMLFQKKNVELIEPPYNRKYMPLGLAKIASFLKQDGAKTEFRRYYSGERRDLICITSLFTYDWQHVIDAVHNVMRQNSEVPVILGGVCATLNATELENMFGHYDNFYLFPGYSQTLDMCVPDYSIDWDMKEAWKNWSFVFTTRGCPNKCGYCAVPKIEPGQWVNPTWKSHILESLPFVMVSDNNLSSYAVRHLESIVQHLNYYNKQVLFDNGFDCKHIDKHVANLLSECQFVQYGCRTAFDRIGEDGTFQKAIELLKTAGVPKSQIMAYVLFNFNDSPSDAVYRMEECLKLGIKPYPQRFVPLTYKSHHERYVGAQWTDALARAFQYFYNSPMVKHTSFSEYVNSPNAHDTWALTLEDKDRLFGVK